MELTILKLMSSRDNYERYSRFLKPEVLTDKGAQVFKDIGEWFDSNPSAEEINYDEFSSWFCAVQHPMFKHEKQEVYRQIFENLKDHEVSEEAQSTIIQSFIQKDYLAQIAELCYAGVEGSKQVSLEQVEDLIEKGYQDTGKIDELESFAVQDSLEEIVQERLEGMSYEFRLEELNVSVGHPKGLIVLGMRPDAGKTTMLASEVTYMAPQLPEERPVIWLNNEEKGSDVKYRIVQAALGKTDDEIDSNPLGCIQEYNQKIGKDKIVVCDNVFHLRDAQALIKKYNPGLVVIDQLWNMGGLERLSENEASRQGLLFREARKLAKEYGPVLVAHQLGRDAEQVKYPDMNSFYLSGTAIQAHADLIITVGMIRDPNYMYSRFLGIVKSKLGKGPRVQKELRHGQFEIEIQPEIARFKGTY